MFGRNTPQQPILADSYQVQSIFRTIQGEGPLSGKPALFVRLTGCHLRCWFCDTEWDDENDPWTNLNTTADMIIEAAQNVGVIVFTGGEPMRYRLQPLFSELRTRGYVGLIQIETAGTYWQDACNMDGVVTIISPKTSRVHAGFYESANAQAFAWKYVLSADAISDEDGLPSAPMQRHIKDDDKRTGGVVARPPLGAVVYVQPCDEYGEDKNRANLMAVRDSSLRFGYTASVQLHKLLGVE